MFTNSCCHVKGARQGYEEDQAQDKQGEKAQTLESRNIYESIHSMGSDGMSVASVCLWNLSLDFKSIGQPESQREREARLCALAALLRTFVTWDVWFVVTLLLACTGLVQALGASRQTEALMSFPAGNSHPSCAIFGIVRCYPPEAIESSSEGRTYTQNRSVPRVVHKG